MKNILLDETAMNIILEDDETSSGGTSHCYETLGEFVEECGLKGEMSIDEINGKLKECGIKPVGDKKRANEFIEEYVKHQISNEPYEWLPNVLASLMQYVSDDDIVEWFYESFLENNEMIEESQEFINVYICEQYRS